MGVGGEVSDSRPAERRFWSWDSISDALERVWNLLACVLGSGPKAQLSNKVDSYGHPQPLKSAPLPKGPFTHGRQAISVPFPMSNLTTMPTPNGRPFAANNLPADPQYGDRRRFTIGFLRQKSADLRVKF